jgi:hypothetical protein
VAAGFAALRTFVGLTGFAAEGTCFCTVAGAFFSATG